jgi:hypothetical protein
LWRAFTRRLGEGMKRKSNPDKSFAVENSFHSSRGLRTFSAVHPFDAP